MTEEQKNTTTQEPASEAATASPASAPPVPDPFEAKADEIIAQAEANERAAQRARIAAELRDAEEAKTREAEEAKAKDAAYRKLRKLVTKRDALADEAESRLADFVATIQKVRDVLDEQVRTASAAGFEDPSVFALNDDLVVMYVLWPLVHEDDAVLRRARSVTPRLYDSYRDRSLAFALRGHRAEPLAPPKAKPKATPKPEPRPEPAPAEPQWEVRTVV